MPEILLVSFGEIDAGILQRLQAFLTGALGMETHIGAARRVPATGLEQARGQYQAGIFIEQLASIRKAAGMLLLGITGLDLFVAGLNFVFGMADRGEHVAMISLARLNPGFYGEAPDTSLYEERILKEAVHELGHVLGLDHCRRPHCIMHYSNTIADTDRKGPDFCPGCFSKLPVPRGRK